MSNNEGNVAPFPISSDTVFRTLNQLLEGYKSAMPKPLDPDKLIWDTIVQNRLFQSIPVDQAIEEATKVLIARRNLFP